MSVRLVESYDDEKEYTRIDVREDYPTAEEDHDTVGSEISAAADDLVSAIDQAGDVAVVGHDPWVLGIVNEVLITRGLKLVAA